MGYQHAMLGGIDVKGFRRQCRYGWETRLSHWALDGGWSVLVVTLDGIGQHGEHRGWNFDIRWLHGGWQMTCEVDNDSNMCQVDLKPSTRRRNGR